MSSHLTDPEAWPDVHLGSWAPAKRSLHLYVQMLGKLRVALSPAQPNWMFTALLLGARGITTGPMPCGERNLQASLDVFSSELTLDLSDGRSRRIPFLPARTVAEIWTDLQAALTDLDVSVALSPVPQEVPDTTPFDEDRTPPAYDPAAVQRWFAAVTAICATFERWRAHFFGRSGVQVWWGAFDAALLLFSGSHVPAPADRGYLLRYDLDAEMMNAGFYLGDENTAPFVYGYIYPQPANAAGLPIAPAAAAWNDTLKEWVLPYAALRAAPNPAALLGEFLDALYGLCESAAGWDRAALSYAAPKRANRT